MSQIDKTQILHIARLARLELTKENIQKYTQEIGNILNFVEELNQAPTSKIAAVGQISGLKNIARTDEVKESLSNEAVLKNAPEQKDGYIKVKQVFGE